MPAKINASSRQARLTRIVNDDQFPFCDLQVLPLQRLERSRQPPVVGIVRRYDNGEFHGQDYVVISLKSDRWATHRVDSAGSASEFVDSRRPVIFAGIPTAIEFGGRSAVTTAPAPTTQPSPIV